jgi:hypothetical protein
MLPAAAGAVPAPECPNAGLRIGASGALPDLVADLNGQIRIDLDGRIDSHNRGIRDTFEVVPDAPVSRFVLELPCGKKSLLTNSENLCQKGAATRATVNRAGQNGKVFDGKVKLAFRC